MLMIVLHRLHPLARDLRRLHFCVDVITHEAACPCERAARTQMQQQGLSQRPCELGRTSMISARRVSHMCSHAGWDDGNLLWVLADAAELLWLVQKSLQLTTAL